MLLQVCALLQLHPQACWQDGSSSSHSIRSDDEALRAPAPESLDNAAQADSRELSMLAMIEFCRQQGLSRYKIPKFVTGMHATLPVNSTGKSDRLAVKRILNGHVQTKKSKL